MELVLSKLDDSTNSNIIKKVFSELLNTVEDKDLFSKSKNILAVHQSAINNEKVKDILLELVSLRVQKLDNQTQIQFWRENVITGYLPDRITLIESYNELLASDLIKLNDLEIINLITLKKLENLKRSFKLEQFIEFQEIYELLEVEKLKDKIFKDLNKIAESHYIPYISEKITSITLNKETIYSELEDILKQLPTFLAEPLLKKIYLTLIDQTFQNGSFHIIADILKENSITEYENVLLYRIDTQSKEDLIYFLNHVESKDDITSAILSKFYKDKEYEVLLEQSKKINEEIFNDYDRLIFETALPEQYIDLWEKKLGMIKPLNYISDFLNHKEERYLKLKTWINSSILSKEEVVVLLIDKIRNNAIIDDRYKFYQVFYAIKNIIELKKDYLEIINPFENDFVNLILWHFQERESFSFETLKGKFIYFKPEDQVSIFKRLFYLKYHGEIDFNLNKLDEITRADFELHVENEKFHDDFVLDISTHIIIESIKAFVNNKNFEFESDYILKDLKKHNKRKFKVDQFFDYCEGRMTAHWNWERNGEISQVFFNQGKSFYYAISFKRGEHVTTNNYYRNYTRYDINPNFGHLKEEVKKLPGRKWNPSEEHWGVPSKYKKEVYEFAKENRFFINLKDGKHYNNNVHLAEYTRELREGKSLITSKNIPNGITFCEGRKANKKHEKFNKEFWWCTNQECFQNCSIDHLSESSTPSKNSDEWGKYTLLDFVKILGINVDESNGFDIIENGHYHMFLGHINAFNRLLERLYCEECESLLYPISSSHFALYRDTQFHCINENCSKKHMKIYLNNCSYGECKTIIDSRISARCEHGLHICTNCGTCCSQDFFKRRYNNLKKNGAYIDPQLIHHFNNKNGHINKKEYYCYNCSDMMTEMNSEIYKCFKCDVIYNMKKFKYLNTRWTRVNSRRKDYPIN